MKKKIYAILLLISIFVLPITAKAEDSYFVADDKAVVSEEYNHNVFAAGETVKNNATVNGIFFGAGSNVEVNGNVSYGFVAGESVNVYGNINNDLFAAGKSLTIRKEGKISRDLYVAANDVTIQSNLPGNGFIVASIVTLDNVVIDGNLRIYANQLNISGNVEIKGTLYVGEDTIINNESNLKVGNKEVSKITRVEFKTRVSDSILSVLTLIFTAIVLALVFPKLFKKLSYELTVKDVFKKMFSGLCVLVIVPILTLILIILSVGVSLGVITLLLYIIGLMISTILSSYVLGYNLYNKAFKQKDNIYVDLIIGILIIKIVEIIPVVGPLAVFATFIYGLGLLYRLVTNESK